MTKSGERGDDVVALREFIGAGLHPRVELRVSRMGPRFAFGEHDRFLVAAFEPLLWRPLAVDDRLVCFLW